MIEQVIKCDACKTPKGATNHWWVIEVEEQNQHPATFPRPRYRVVLTALANWQELAPKDLHLCGEACVQKKISELMGTISRTIAS